MAKETAARILAADDGGGAAEVQIDAEDGVALEGLGGADEAGEILADHLGDDRFAGRVPVDGAEDRFLGLGIAVDSEVLGVVEIGAAVAVDDGPELEIGDILHRGQDQQGAARREDVGDGGHGVG